MFHHWLLQLQLAFLLATICSVSSQHYTYNQEHNAAVPVPSRFLVPGTYVGPAPEHYQLQAQGKKVLPNADVAPGAEYDDRRVRRPYVARRRPDEPAVAGNTVSVLPTTMTETYRPTTWSTPLLLQQSPQSPAAAPASPFIYTPTTQRTGSSAGDTSPPAFSTIADSNSAEEGFTRRLPGTLTPYRPTKVQYFPINNPNIIDENEETAVFHNVKTEAPQISSTSVTPEASSPNHIQRTKSYSSRFGTNNIRTPRPQQKVRPHPPSQPVILPPTSSQSQSSYENTADADSNKITRTYDSSPRHESNQQRGKRIKKPVAQVLRKYRDDNPDGSITWGFENDDGSYKEETIGNDCVTRGKYGYIDPDGVRREYSYVQGLPCDRNKLKQEEEEDVDEPEPQTLVKHRARKPVQKY